MELTVTPSNIPAYSLYRKLAGELKTACRESMCFPAHYFAGAQHEDELALRIGPFKRAADYKEETINHEFGFKGV